MLDLETHVYAASFLNALFLAIQLIQIVRTKSVKGVSLITYSGFFYIQCVYIVYGYHHALWHIFSGMVISAVITATIVVLKIRWWKKA